MSLTVVRCDGAVHRETREEKHHGSLRFQLPHFPLRKPPCQAAPSGVCFRRPRSSPGRRATAPAAVTERPPPGTGAPQRLTGPLKRWDRGSTALGPSGPADHRLLRRAGGANGKTHQSVVPSTTSSASLTDPANIPVDRYFQPASGRRVTTTDPSGRDSARRTAA